MSLYGSRRPRWGNSTSALPILKGPCVSIIHPALARHSAAMSMSCTKRIWDVLVSKNLARFISWIEAALGCVGMVIEHNACES